MPIIILSRQEITSKGVKYCIYHAIGENGEGVQLFLNPQQEAEFGIPSSAICTPAQLKELFNGDLPQVDVQFNQRGRLVSTKV